MIIQSTHTHPVTHTLAQTLSTAAMCTGLILHAGSPLTEQFWAASAKRFIKTSKRDGTHHFPPQLQFGKISMGTWNWISCVICIHVLSLAIPLNLQQAVFFCASRGGDEGEEAAVCVCV